MKYKNRLLNRVIKSCNKKKKKPNKYVQLCLWTAVKTFDYHWFRPSVFNSLK